MYDSFRNHSHISTLKYKFNSVIYKLDYGINSVKIINQDLSAKSYRQLIPTYNKTVCIQTEPQNRIKTELFKGYLRYNIPKRNKILEYFIQKHCYKNIIYTEPCSTLCLSTTSNNNITTDFKKYDKISNWWFKNFKNESFIYFKK